MSKLSRTMQALSKDLITQIELVTETGKNNEFKKRRVVDMWNTYLTPSNTKIAALDNYSREVVYGFRSMVSRHMIQALTYDELLVYIKAVIKLMSKVRSGDWNEKS